MLETKIIELKKTILSIKDYGFFFGIKYSFLRGRFYHHHKGMEQYISCVNGYLENFLKEQIESYKRGDEITVVGEESKNVWVCWWQGEETMPEWCKMCYENLKRTIPTGYTLHLINRDNVSNYVDIPQYVYERLNKGFLTVTQFSDILREALLYFQGGLWIDASVWTTPNFYRFLDTNREFFSIKLGYIHRPEMVGQKISNCMWSGFFMYGKKGCLVAKFAFDGMCAYYKKHVGTIDYFIQNFIIRIGYNNIPKIKEMIDSYPINNHSLYVLPDLVYKNAIYDPDIWNEVTSNTGVFKITQKRKYLESVDGKKTFYGHLKELYQQQIQ